MKNILQESCSYYERYTVSPSDTARALYYYLQWAGHFTCLPDFYIRRQNLKSMLLLQTVSGRGILHYENQQMTLEPDTVVLIDCMLPHTYYPKDGVSWEFRFLHFTGGRSYEMFQHLCTLAGGCVFPVTGQIESCVTRCLQYCREDPIFNEVRISKAISDILYAIALDNQQAEAERLNEVCRYIKNNFSQKLTTEVLAATFRFSRSYFAMQFKKHTGITLHDYLLVCRMTEAKRLLGESDLSVSQIGEAVGFTDTGTFIRAFRRKEKCTPLQYRKHCGV